MYCSKITLVPPVGPLKLVCSQATQLSDRISLLTDCNVTVRMLYYDLY